jgi:hypothetical protein
VGGLDALLSQKIVFSSVRCAHWLINRKHNLAAMTVTISEFKPVDDPLAP